MRLDSSGYFLYSPLSNYGNYACYGQINAATNIVSGLALYTPTVYIGTGILGSGYGMICKRIMKTIQKDIFFYKTMMQALR